MTEGLCWQLLPCGAHWGGQIEAPALGKGQCDGPRSGPPNIPGCCCPPPLQGLGCIFILFRSQSTEGLHASPLESRRRGLARLPPRGGRGAWASAHVRTTPSAYVWWGALCLCHGG